MISTVPFSLLLILRQHRKVQLFNVHILTQRQLHTVVRLSERHLAQLLPDLFQIRFSLPRHTITPFPENRLSPLPRKKGKVAVNPATFPKIFIFSSKRARILV